ncbi:hypothetical protein GCM10028774_24090 [Spirosoma jeollabukense]
MEFNYKISHIPKPIVFHEKTTFTIDFWIVFSTGMGAGKGDPIAGYNHVSDQSNGAG